MTIQEEEDPWIAAMRAGRHAAAYRINDDVLQARLRAGGTADDPSLPYHARFVWTGGDLDGRRVLVRCYHGLGDTLMASRFLAPLRLRARHVTLEAPAGLASFLERADLADRVVSFAHGSPLPPDERDVEITELGHALRLGPLDARPVAPPAAPAALDRGTIAFCWRAGEWLADRSVPLDALAHVLRATGRPLVSVQHGPALPDARRRHPDLFDGPGRDGDDLGRTAALLAGASRVVTVDTMVAHLALLLGRPTIVLLKRRADWRWGDASHASSWYPEARLLRQARDGDWSSPLDALARALRREG